MILLSLPVSIGFVQLSTYFYKDELFYLYPLGVALLNIFLGLLSVHLVSEAHRMTNGRLGNFQEYIYYVTGDRSLIITIGLQYFLCLISMAIFCYTAI